MVCAIIRVKVRSLGPSRTGIVSAAWDDIAGMSVGSVVLPTASNENNYFTLPTGHPGRSEESRLHFATEIYLTLAMLERSPRRLAARMTLR